MTYTLLQVRDILRAAPNSVGHIHLRAGDCADMADSIDLHLSQPQPVAQGEAVAWQCRGVMAGHFTEWKECEKEHYDKRTPLTGWGDREIETEFREIFATPIIPTGYRLVPVDSDRESADGPCKEADGCPTEMAVLKRFWREHQPKERIVDMSEAMDILSRRQNPIDYDICVQPIYPNAAPTGGG